MFQKLTNYICSTSVRRICTLSGSGEEFRYSALYDFVYVNSLMIPTVFIVMYPDYICWYSSLCVSSTLKLNMFAVNGYFRYYSRRNGLNRSDLPSFWDITQDCNCVLSHKVGRPRLLRGTSLKSRMGLTLRLLMSYIYIYIYIYGAPILDVSRSHTTTQHSR